jgi:Homeobox KN domain
MNIKHHRFFPLVRDLWALRDSIAKTSDMSKITNALQSVHQLLDTECAVVECTLIPASQDKSMIAAIVVLAHHIIDIAQSRKMNMERCEAYRHKFVENVMNGSRSDMTHEVDIHNLFTSSEHDFRKNKDYGRYSDYSSHSSITGSSKSSNISTSDSASPGSSSITSPTLRSSEPVSRRRKVFVRKTLPVKAKTFLRQWLQDNRHDPYPTPDEKEVMAYQCGLSVKQVSDFLMNGTRL